MTADYPTILATSGGIGPGDRTALAFTALSRFAVELSGVNRTPKVTFIGTATGDQQAMLGNIADAARAEGWDLTQLRLFSMPNVDPVDAILGADVAWVMGGSVANLLAVWQVHELGPILRQAWQAGVVLTGVSAGSICWHVGGVTDSFGPDLRPVTNGLGFLPYGNGVHYDGEATRRPAIHRFVADGTLPTTYCSDDGVGLLYRGTEFSEAVSETDGAAAYLVESRDGQALETRIEARRL